MISMLGYAADYAEAGYEVFPLRGKVPLIPGGRGCLDATTDMAQVYEWWQRWPTANIGVRIPEAMFVLDVDPRHNGEHSLLDLVHKHGPLPPTRTSYSGRGDGGRHLWWLHPGGRLSSTRLGEGLDIKTHAGYVVVPPSRHPEGGPYWWATPAIDPVLPPQWLTALLLPPPAPPKPVRASRAFTGPTPADALTWAEILVGWYCLDPPGDQDGARWRHPNASPGHPWSATIRHGVLFVYSGNTAFEVTEAGTPHGYTKLRAFATINSQGNCKAAYRLLQGAAR